MKLILPFLLIATLQTAKCAKILGIFPSTYNSHYILAKSLMRGLAEKGHDVTIISALGEHDRSKNGTYKEIVILGKPAKDNEKNNLFEVDKMNFVTISLFMNSVGNFMTEQTLSDPNVQKLLDSDEKFDLVILEQFINDGLKVFAHHYDAPLVILTTVTSNAWINPLVCNPAPPSYIPELHTYFDHKKFFHRLRNAIVNIFGELNRHFLFFPSQNKIIKKYFPEAPDLNVLNYNISLVLLNSHVSVNKAVPRVPNMVDIGGFHVQPPKKLSQDLQEYLDGAKDGVIYFSMGSALQSVYFSVEKREALLRVFSKLKQKVLWKWEDDVLPGQPPNVRLGKWLPQQDILAHPNIKIFITHGGLLSLIESVYHGIPVLSIPVFGDQVMNAAEATRNGFGRHILHSELNEQTFSEALDDILNNFKYKENVNRRSKIMNDRQNKPMDDVDYWIQYVIRHGGAPHLRVAGLDLSWYQYLCLDVAAFISALILTLTYLLYILVRKIICKFSATCKSKSNKMKIKKN